MPQFKPDVPVTTREPTVTAEGLAPGRYTFRLVVLDAAGNRSAPATHTVEVVLRLGDAPRGEGPARRPARTRRKKKDEG
jgi:hypothetical protein